MPLPTILFSNFNNGKQKLEVSAAKLNEFAKWMQSPNIPRSTHLPMAIEHLETVKDTEPTVSEWLNQLESNTRKNELPMPLFFPRSYHTSKYFTTQFKNNDKWIRGLMTANDPLFSVYSENSKAKIIRDFITKATNIFPKMYDASVFRLYKEKKPEIYSALFKDATPAGLHVFSMVLDKNILVVREYGYEWCSYVSKARDTLCFWERNDDMGVAINTELKGSFDVDEIILRNLDLYEERTKKIKIASNKETLQKCRDLMKKTVQELQQSATDQGVEIEDEDGKKLKKQELIDNLLEKFHV